VSGAKQAAMWWSVRGLMARLACVIEPAPLLIVENDLRGSFVELKLGTHFLNLRRLLFEARGNSFHSPLLLRDCPPESPSAAGPLQISVE